MSSHVNAARNAPRSRDTGLRPVLSEALRAANLHESAAARAAIARALPSNAPRVDTFTTGQVGFPYR